MFKSALTHDVAYNSLLTSKTKAIHARVGERIEEMYSSRLVEYYEIIAYHYERGEVWKKAIQYLILAGEKALRNMAIPSALSFFKKAADIIKQKDLKLLADQEYEIYQGKGNAEFNIGSASEAEKDFFKGIDMLLGGQRKETVPYFGFIW